MAKTPLYACDQASAQASAQACDQASPELAELAEDRGQRWAQLRSATEGCAGDALRIDEVVRALIAWPVGPGDERAHALEYARAKLSRQRLPGPQDHGLTLWEVIAWCLAGAPALRAHVGRFSPVVDQGAERWIEAFAWATVASHAHGVALQHTQVASTLSRADGVRRQLLLVTTHEGWTTVLDVQQSQPNQTVALVSDPSQGLTLRWQADLGASR